ncbi:MAG: hypothetical protein HP053_00250 [Christensenellaceae bacterium]|nr:hypothetical protein [Christensenellaceae bacterium]
MPTLSKPINIPGPWAYNGDKNTIPDTGADVGLASWAQGWGLVNQLPLTAGGIPPARADFNGALNALSAHVYYQQSGAYYDWSADLMYPFPARVLGSDGKVYDWVSASGAGTSAGAQDPTKDSDRTWWTPAVTGGDLPEFDGTTIKLINGKYGVPEFTAPTAGTPGKAGLVPGPEATPENELLLRFFSARGWGKLAPQFFDRVWTTEGADTLTLGIITVPNDTNIDTLTTPGRYYCSQFQSVFGAYAGTVEVYYLKGSTSDGQRSALQIYYCDAGFMAARGSSNLFPVDGTPSFTPTWTIWSAPRPQTAAGLGQWRLLWGGRGAGPSVTLPDGAVWAYHVIGMSQTGEVVSGGAGVLGGGTVITLTNAEGIQITDVLGFCWEVLA